MRLRKSVLISYVPDVLKLHLSQRAIDLYDGPGSSQGTHGVRDLNQLIDSPARDSLDLSLEVWMCFR